MFLAVTFAPAIMLPLGSITEPRMAPRKLCAHAVVPINNSNRATAAISKIRMVRVRYILLLCMMASLSGMGQFYGTVNHPGHEGSRRNACYVRHAPRACGS